jgi:hypothetical protein
MTRVLLLRVACLTGLCAALACGGSKGHTRNQGAGGGNATGANGWDEVTGDSGDAGVAAGPADAAPPPPLVTFELVNTGTSQLSFSMNKGWQPIIFAWSGQRGKNAKPIIMFPKHCTAACDALEDQRCPHCPGPETNKEARAMQQYVHVEPGQTHSVPWDGLVFGYEKGRGIWEGAPRTCECFRRAEPEPAEYTVWACGVRLTAAAGVSSRPQCIEAKMKLPVEDPPARIRFEFPDSKPPQKQRRR